MTSQERVLRAALGETLPGLHFRFQTPFGRYHPDFCSHSARLIIEVDGSQHAEAATYDAERTAFFESQGYRVLRLWNNEVSENLEGVIQAILATLPSPLVGEGGAQRRMGGARRRSARAASPASTLRERNMSRLRRVPTPSESAPPTQPSPTRGEGSGPTGPR